MQLNHELVYNEPLNINFEASYFEATRFRRPLLEGWNDVIFADPQILLDRGYDKVILVTRELTDLCESLALYHRGAKTPTEIINLILEEPKFFSNIQKKCEKIDKDIRDPRLFKFSLNEWNHFTLQTFNELLDFLEYPKRPRLALAPIKVNRDFEGYSCSHLPKEYQVCENIEVIRKR